MRQRTLSPRFFSDEDLVDLPPATRLLFAGLWCLADREGRLEDRPRRIRLDLHLAGVDVDAALDELAGCGKVRRYEVDGVRYLVVIRFGKHQRPHPKEVASVIPAPAVESNGKPCNSTASRGIQRQAEHFPSGPSKPSKPSEPSRVNPPSPTETPPGGRAVFEAWVESTGRRGAKFTADRRRIVAARLHEGFTEADLCDACRGWTHDPWEGRAQQNDLTQLLRSGSTVEKFRDLWRNPRPTVVARSENPIDRAIRERTERFGGHSNVIEGALA